MAADDKPRLLIVEDDPGLQRQLKWCFDQYEVLMASTRSEALVLLRRFEPPVVLQDLGLPLGGDDDLLQLGPFGLRRRAGLRMGLDV